MRPKKHEDEILSFFAASWRDPRLADVSDAASCMLGCIISYCYENDVRVVPRAQAESFTRNGVQQLRELVESGVLREVAEGFEVQP